MLHSFQPLLYIILQWRRWRRSSYTRFIVIRRYLASKKGSPGDSRQSTWSVVLQFDAHADVVENRNYHNDIHICRRIAGIQGRSFYCPESWISCDLEGSEEKASDLVVVYAHRVDFILQVIARLQVTWGFINCLDVVSRAFLGNRHFSYHWRNLILNFFQQNISIA